MIEIRPATHSDLSAITEIYNDAILTTTATFDTEPRTADQQLVWFDSHGSQHPVLVADRDGEVVGWVSLSKWSDRAAYRETAETSYYVARRHRGKGIGRQLVQAVIDQAQLLGFRALIARVAEGSQISLKLTESLGFKRIGVLRQVGQKFGRRLDVYMLQLMLKPANRDVASLVEQLRWLTQIILDPGQPAHSLRPEVLETGALFADATAGSYSRKCDIGDGETVTSDGLAVSPTMAAMCLDDYIRTIVFVRGLFSAINAARVNVYGRPIRVLYVGCGPYATLALPLMSVLQADEASFTLLDIHAESINSVRSIISAFDFSDRVAEYLVGDAADYKIDSRLPPDVIVMEVMQTALEKEPQVSMSRHLLRQAPDAILVPEDIRVDLALVDPGAEFGYDSDPGNSRAASQSPIVVSNVFALNRNTIQSWPDEMVGELPAAAAIIPDPVKSEYQPMLLTVIQVHGGHILTNRDCGLTCPRSLAVDDADALRLVTRFSFVTSWDTSPGYVPNWFLDFFVSPPVVFSFRENPDDRAKRCEFGFVAE